MAENGQLAEEYHPQQTPSPSLSPMLSPSRTKWRINKNLLPIKGYYFVFLAAVGDLLPFISVYMLHLGLTPQETGIIYGVMPFVGFFVRPVIGAVSDKYKKHKLVLILVTAVSGIFYFLLVFIPQRMPLANVDIVTEFACNNQDSFFKDCHVSSRHSECSVGLTQFANSTEFRKLNRSISCTVLCQSKPDNVNQEFHACFTNGTGQYGTDGCIGASYKKNLNFLIPDYQKLIASEIPLKRQQVDSVFCLNYDIKDLHLDNNSSYEALQILCDRELLMDCLLNCSQVMQCKESTAIHLDITFCLFFFIFLIANMMFAPIFSILDAAAYESLGENRHLWGQQRVWGTFGFALFAVTSTFIMEFQRNSEQYVEYEVSFYVFLPLTILAAFIANFITMSTDIRCGQFVKNIWHLLKNMEVSAFLFVVMYFGVLTGALETFLFWFLITIGSSPLVFGFILLVDCCAEVPMLWVAGTIIKKIGLVTCLYLALVCYGIRMIVFSFLEEPWLVLLVEPLYGVCFALMYAAASSYASIIAPPGMSATVQGLLGGVHFGFGKGLGSFITGFMFESIGPRWTWRVYSIISGILLVVYVILNMFVFKPDNRPSSARQPVNQGSPDEESKQVKTLISSNSG